MPNDTLRDANFIPVMSGQGDNGKTYPWSIDHITGRVIVDITVSTNNSPSSPVSRALRDANFKPTVIGVGEDLITPLSAAIDNTNGALGIDLIIE